MRILFRLLRLFGDFQAMSRGRLGSRLVRRTLRRSMRRGKLRGPF
ncbi:hypothetical protein [Fodinicurvata sp. EGI_FJ10296]